MTTMNKITKTRYGVRYDYNTEYSCEESGCDHICRCGRITDLHVTDVRASCLTRDVLDIPSDKKLKGHEQILYYAVDRLIRIYKLKDDDKWYGRVTAGYYGEEVLHFSLEDTEIKKALSKLSEFKYLKEIIEFVLKEEYGFLLDRLKDATYGVKKVTLTDIEVPNMDYCRRIDRDLVTKYVKEWNYEIYNKEVPDYPLCVVEKDSLGSLRLIDGYHRYHAAKEAEFDTILVIVATTERQESK